MENQFVPYELAVKLRELGYDELCLAEYYGGGVSMLPSGDPLRNSEIKIPWFATAPLWQQAFDWFRKEINFESAILSNNYGYYFIIVLSDRKTLKSVSISKYEDCREACLRKLIEKSPFKNL